MSLDYKMSEEHLKQKLKKWEKKFEAKYGRIPNKDDIHKYPDVGKKKKQFFSFCTSF
jgi:hypothetical protein